MKRFSYQVVRKATAFGYSDQVLSCHTTIKAAERAFDKVNGSAVLVNQYGEIVNSKLV